jgi:hypothetical protein
LSRSQETDDSTGIRYLSDYDRPVVLDAIANYHFNDRWKASVKYNYKSGKLYSPADYFETESETATPEELMVKNNQRTDSHSTVNLRFEYARKNRNSDLLVYLDIINLLNTTNVGRKYKNSYTYFDSDGNEIEVIGEPYEESVELYPYILPLLGLKLTF